MVHVKENKKLPPPLEVAVNRNNISNIENALLESYKYHTPDSLYDITRNLLELDA